MKNVQYHLGLKQGDVAPYVLLCGDPARAAKVARFFDHISVKKAQREFITYTGSFRTRLAGRDKKIPLTVISTGIGPDNTEIVLSELSQIASGLTLIRIGSCGGLQPETRLGHLVISTGAVRLENTSLFIVPEGYPALAHYEVVRAMKEAAEAMRLKYHLGLTATAPGFYAAQGRAVAGLPLRYPDLNRYLRDLGVLNFEMETSVLLTLAQLKGYRAGSVSAVYADRYHYQFITPTRMRQAELNCIKLGLKTMEKLA